MTDVRLLALERDVFLAAVAGHARSRTAAEAVVAERLGSEVRGIPGGILGAMQYAESILDLVGRTPLVRLTRVTRDLGPLPTSR